MESPVDSSSSLDETTVVVQCVSKGYQECSFDGNYSKGGRSCSLGTTH